METTIGKKFSERERDTAAVLDTIVVREPFLGGIISVKKKKQEKIWF